MPRAVKKSAFRACSEIVEILEYMEDAIALALSSCLSPTVLNLELGVRCVGKIVIQKLPTQVVQIFYQFRFCSAIN